MQKIISLLLLLACLFLLVLPVRWLISTSENIRLEMTKCPVDSGDKVLRMTAGKLEVHVAAATPASMYAKAYCVMDTESGRVLLSKNSDQKMPMASTTKIMTCILALESGKLDEFIPVSTYAASMPDVQLNIREGEKYRLKDMLYSLMLESHNDTAVAIAEYLGGSVKEFAELMNQKATELGCTSTHFVTPNGLDDQEHYTTAKELCIIASYAIQNESFLKIIQTPQYRFQEKSGNRKFLVSNHDAFLQQYKGAIGIKTGFTGNAGYCFCGAASRNGRTLVSSVLACGWPPNRSYKWSDTGKLMDYGFQGFKTCTIPEPDEAIYLPVQNGQKSYVSVSKVSNNNEQVQMPLKADDVIEIKQTLPEMLSAPVREGDIVGTQDLMLNGTQIKSVPMIAEESVRPMDIPYVFSHLLRQIMFQ